MKKLIFFSYFFFCMFSLFAQSAITELKKVNRAYSAAENLSMEITARVYKDKNDKTGSVLGSGWMKKSGTNYYSKFGKDEMLINKKASLIIDNQNKHITYFEPKSTEIKNTGQLPDIDSIISSSDSIVYKGETADSKHFCFYDEQAAIKQTDLYIYKNNSFIKQIIYYYRENTDEENFDMYKVMIDYKNIKLDKLNEGQFSEAKYILLDQGKIKLAPAYKTYKLKLSENE